MKELISGVVLEKLPFLPQILARPRWLASYLLDGGLPPLPNVVIPGRGPMPLPDVVAALAESTVTWDDLKWIRELRRGPVVVNANPLSELITRVTSRAAPTLDPDGIILANVGFFTEDVSGPQNADPL